MAKSKKKTKTKSPLEEAAEALKNLTPEDLKRMRRSAAKKAEEYEKDREDQFWLRGKYDPRNKPLGICRVCQGSIVAKRTRGYHGDRHNLIMGPGSRQQMSVRDEGYYCLGCGIRYLFVPAEAIDNKP